MKSIRSLLFVVSLCILSSAGVSGSPLNLVEPGDFQNRLGLGPPFEATLDVGLNTISGSVQGVIDLSQGDYLDIFTVVLPSNLIMISAQLVVTNFTFGSGTSVVHPGYMDPGAAVVGDGTYPLINWPRPGVQDIAISSPESSNYPACCLRPGGFNYRLEYQVAAVPEPSGALLLTIGLSLLALKRSYSKATSRLTPG